MLPLCTFAVIAPLLVFSHAFPSPGDKGAAAAPDSKPHFGNMSFEHAPATHAAVKRQSGGVVTGSLAVTSINNKDGVGAGTDAYKMYKGDGSASAGWPPKEKWVSFDDMFTKNKQVLSSSCSWFGADNDSPAEIQALYDAIQQVAQETKVDHRYILATVLQESGGCVRVPTTGNIDPNINNPGLMQCHSGAGTCANTKPCPASTITTMVREGTAGTSKGPGLAQLINQAQTSKKATGSAAFYVASRLYNSGSVDPSGLEGGCCTHCYASDIANRLTGWVSAVHGCNL